MLETARRQGASIFVYLIFCLLIAIFVINFGPQGGQGGGCNDSANVVISIDGNEASQSAWHVAYSNGYNRGQSKDKKFRALETLILRDLLAQAAEERGMRVTDDLIDEQIKRGNFFLGMQRLQLPGALEEIDGEKFYNHKAVRAWASSMNISLNSYREEQKRTYMASLMAQILRDSVAVSRDEALNHYLFENNTVQYDVVAFRPDAYKSAMKLTDADVERFLASHAGEVEAKFKADERTYKGMKPQLQLRQIFIANPAEEPAAATPAGSGSAAGSGAGSAADAAAGSAAGNGAGSAAAPDAVAKTPAADTEAEKAKANKLVEAAKGKLEAARVAIAAGKQKFADAARTLNTDETMRSTGGDLGWRTQESAMLGDKALTDAVKTLKPGEMTPVIVTDRGVYLIIAEGKREGDLTFEQVKHELARELAKDVWSKEAAKRAAIAALDKARSGTAQNLDQMFEKSEAPKSPGIDIQQIINDPNIPDDQKQKIIEMLMQQQAPQQSGSLTFESRDIPASWRAQADGAGGSSTPAPTAGSAVPAPTKPTPPAPTAGSAATPAAGSAATPATSAGSAAAGSGATTAPATPPTPAGATAAPLAATTEQLPAFGDVAPPNVSRFGPAPRATSMAGLGTSKAAVSALFDELSAGMLAKQVYEADGAFVIVQLISRTSPKVEEFEKDADRLVEEMRRDRGQAFLKEWLKDRCSTLSKDGKIKPNRSLIQDFDDNGKPLPIEYQPCMSLRDQ